MCHANRTNPEHTATTPYTKTYFCNHAHCKNNKAKLLCFLPRKIFNQQYQQKLPTTLKYQ